MLRGIDFIRSCSVEYRVHIYNREGENMNNE